MIHRILSIALTDLVLVDCRLRFVKPRRTTPCTILPISPHHICFPHIFPIQVFLMIPIPFHSPQPIPSYHHPVPIPKTIASFTLQKDVNRFVGNGQKERIRGMSRGSNLEAFRMIFGDRIDSVVKLVGWRQGIIEVMYIPWKSKGH